MFGLGFGYRDPSLRPANADEQERVETFLQSAARLHLHLDWRRAAEWVGEQPYLLAERGRRLVGVLGCPPDPPDTAWVRAFASQGRESVRPLWEFMWAAAEQMLRQRGVALAAGLSLESWMDSLYLTTGFERTHAVVVLNLLPASVDEPDVYLPPDVVLRRARPNEEAAVAVTDQAAFASPWQISLRVMQAALHQAWYVTVLEKGGRLIGYQLSTPSQEGAHLARLAVRPEYQGRGLGRALVADLVRRARMQGLRVLSVNTQDSNRASLSVYQQAGFHLTGVQYPVYERWML